MTEQGAIDRGYYLVLSYKGYNIYVRTNHELYGFPLKIFNATNGKEILHKRYKCKNKDIVQENIDKVIKIWKDKLFTEEDICTPCTSLQEYKKKEEFLCKIYVRNAYYENDVPCLGTDINTAIYDPVSDCFLYSEYVEFIKHHVWLYIQLILSNQPSVFLEDSDPLYSIYDYMRRLLNKVEWYLYAIEYIQEDELLYQDAKEIIKTVVNTESYYWYFEDYEGICMKLISDGYIVKKSILEYLLCHAQKL